MIGARVGIVTLGLMMACDRERPEQTPVWDIPRATAPVTIDGKSDDTIWPVAWRSPPLEDARGHRTPHAELRLAGDDECLYALVYAADEELRTRPRSDDPRGVGDEIRLTVGNTRIQLGPGRHEAPEGVRVAMNMDGSVDEAGDMDEEWITEIAIPWKHLGATAQTDGVPVRMSRVDAPKGERERALAWPKDRPARVRLQR